MKTLSILKSISEIIFTSITFVLVPLVVITLLSSRISLFGLKSFVVLTGSMAPLIPIGSIVYTVQDTIFRPGDIITFQDSDHKITHRIVDVVDKDGKRISSVASPIGIQTKSSQIFYKTKGDANNSRDSNLVSKDKIIGKVFVHVPSLGKLSAFIKSIPGFLILIALPTVIFIGFELWNIKKEVERITERKTLKKYGLIQ